MKKPLRMGDVCRQLDLQPYVLRYWETEFPMLRTGDAGGANRVYGAEEVALLGRIKSLLYEEGYTIAGARKKLESDPRPAAGREPAAGEPAIATDAGEEGAGAAPATTVTLDTQISQRIEQLERGVEAALREARAILEHLEPRS